MSSIFKGTGTIIIKRTPGSTFQTKIGGGGVLPISPQELSSLAIWTPIESASFNQGTFQEPTDGGNICGWFAQASSSELGWIRIRQSQAFCPAFVATSSDFNDLPAIHFDDASNEQLDLFVETFPNDLFFLHNSSSWVMMLVLMISGTNPGDIQTIYDNLDDNNNGRQGINLRYRDDGANNDILQFHMKNSVTTVVSGSTAQGGFSAGNPHILSVVHTSGSELKIFVDGLQSGGDGVFPTTNDGYSQLNTSDDLQFGLSTLGTRPANMFWTEFVMYSGSKSEGDRQGVEKFFSNKYNISVPF